MIIAIDFDGTICEHEYPEIGDTVPGAIDWIRSFQAAGADIILWTMRSGKPLGEAVRYLQSKKIMLFGINSNPEQTGWSQSPKAYAHLYIDDAAVGCPLVSPPTRRAFVDWSVVGPRVMDQIRLHR